MQILGHRSEQKSTIPELCMMQLRCLLGNSHGGRMGYRGGLLSPGLTSLLAGPHRFLDYRVCIKHPHASLRPGNVFLERFWGTAAVKMGCNRALESLRKVSWCPKCCMTHAGRHLWRLHQFDSAFWKRFWGAGEPRNGVQGDLGRVSLGKP